MKHLFLVGAFLFVFYRPILAQESSETIEQQANELKQDFTKPIAEWDDAFVQTTFQKFLDLYIRGILWDPTFHAEMKTHLPDSPPQIQVRVSQELRTPYLNQDQIIIPVSYLRYLYAVGLLIGHDVYTQDHNLPLGRPLLTTPFRKSAILPLLARPDQAVDVTAFPSLQVYLQCPAQSLQCQTMEQQAFCAVLLFALLHELSHELFHHIVTDEGVNVDQEIAADGNAYLVLRHFADGFKDFKKEARDELELTYKVAPLAWLEVETTRQGIANVVAKARQQALLQKYAGEELEEIETLIEPEHSSHNTQRLEVVASERPDMLFFDGMAITPAEVIGKKLVVARMKHTVIATRPGKIAVGQSDGSDTRKDAQLHLTFRSLPALNTKAVDEAATHRNWLDVLFLTSTDQLQARDPRVSVQHWKAIERLGLSGGISVAEWNSIPTAEWGQVLEWQRRGQALATWY